MKISILGCKSRHLQMDFILYEKLICFRSLIYALGLFNNEKAEIALIYVINARS